MYFYEHSVFVRFIVRKISNSFYRYVRKQVDFYKHLWYNINKKKKDVKKIESRTYYYARVSSREQNLDRQILAFQSLGADERSIFTDHESGKNLERVGYQALKNTMLRSGDTLVIKSLDRLSRNKTDIKNELQYFKDNNIRLKVIDLPTTMMDLPKGQEWVFEMVNNILIEVLGTIAEQERNTQDCSSEGRFALASEHKSGAEIVGAGIVIEKAFQEGGKIIREDYGIRCESLARIKSMSYEDGIEFTD